MNSRLSRKYAEALYLAARERDSAAMLLEQLQVLAEPLRGELGRFLQSARLSKARIVETVSGLVEELFSGQDVQLLVNLLRLVVEKGRSALLPEIIDEYAARCDEEAGIERGEVTVAATLDPELLAELEADISRWRRQTVKLSQREDPALLGGFIVHLTGHRGSAQIDASLRNRLQQLQRQLLVE